MRSMKWFIETLTLKLGIGLSGQTIRQGNLMIRVWNLVQKWTKQSEHSCLKHQVGGNDPRALVHGSKICS